MNAGLLQRACLALVDHGRAARRVPHLIVISATAVIYTAANPSSAVGDRSAYAFVAFLLFLLGVWLALLQLVDPRMPAGRLLRPARRVRLLIVNSGVLFMSTAGSIIIYSAANPSSAVGDPAYALVAFVLFLLGVWLALLQLVAEQFPRAARIGVAIARALQDYLFGGN